MLYLCTLKVQIICTYSLLMDVLSTILSSSRTVFTPQWLALSCEERDRQSELSNVLAFKGGTSLMLLSNSFPIQPQRWNSLPLTLWLTKINSRGFSDYSLTHYERLRFEPLVVLLSKIYSLLSFTFHLSLFTFQFPLTPLSFRWQYRSSHRGGWGVKHHKGFSKEPHNL